MNTPKPWRLGTSGDTVVADVLPDGALQGSNAIEYYGGYLIAESVAPCNRPLIAAAPELLEALEAMLDTDKVRILSPVLLKQARAAIEKAKHIEEE